MPIQEERSTFRKMVVGLINLSLIFKYDGIAYLASSPSSTWRLSLQDGKDFVDVNNRKYMSLIRKVASQSGKVILNIEESLTPSPIGFDSKANKRYKLDHNPLRADQRIQSGSKKTLFGSGNLSNR